MSWITQHKLLFIVIIVLVAGGVWYGLSQSGTAAPALSTSNADGSIAATGSTAAADQDLVSTLLTLRSVTLSGTIFTEAAFASLHDFSTTIIPEPVGRPNPFAPLTTGQATTTESKHAAGIFAPQK